MPVLGLLRSPAQGKPARHNSSLATDFVLTGCVDTYAAMAVAHPKVMLAETALSQASQLPQLICVGLERVRVSSPPVAHKVEENRRGKAHRIQAVQHPAVAFDHVPPILHAPVALDRRHHDAAGEAQQVDQQRDQE